MIERKEMAKRLASTDNLAGAESTQHAKPFRYKPIAAAVVGLMVGGTAIPNVQAQDQSSQVIELEEVVVTGIRSSLKQASDLKRSSAGVVDAITAEDIGVFPDTNLAESLQRISGVSIDRSRGEGSTVTVRGFGPEFNLVTLNGRQIPTYERPQTQIGQGRSFDFTNLSSDAISGLEVYKTGKAEVSGGGIGSTINVRTAKPLDNPGEKVVFSAKTTHDTSTTNGSDLTPEVSGIYSNTFADDKFGVAISASYKERDHGENIGRVLGWRSFDGDNLGGDWGTLPDNGLTTGLPGAGGIYSVPQQSVFRFQEFESERVNGQLTLQYQPTDNVRATVDYTYAETDTEVAFNQFSAWYNFTPDTIGQFDGSNVAAPLVFQSTQGGDNGFPGQDFVIITGSSGETTELNSLGFNLEWDVNDRLSFEFDYHDSSATVSPNGPFGSFAELGLSSFTRERTTTFFDGGDVPVLSLGLTNAPNPEDFIVTGSNFVNEFSEQDINEASLAGSYELNGASSINFGVRMTEVDHRTAFANIQRNDWGGITTTSPGDVADLLTPATLSNQFDDFGPVDPRAQADFFTFDFQEVIDRTTTLGASNDTRGPCGTGLCAPDEFTSDRRTTEDTTALYLSYNTEFSLFDRPLGFNVGLRYEETDVESAALSLVIAEIRQEGFNEFPAIPAVDENGGQITDFTTLTGEYDATLPNLDLRYEINDNLVARFSYSETITRPDFADIQGGIVISQLLRVNGGTASAGNPDLLPFESENIDISLEYYLNDGDYFSIGYFTKDVANFIGTGIDQDVVLFPGLIHPATGQDATFDVTVPVNEEEANVDGVEIAVQKAFGDSGFGIIANATFVDGDIEYDVLSLGGQFALTGLSDSANLIAYYEKDNITARIAYNWRDDFLQSTTDRLGQNEPVFVDSFGQLDIRASYAYSDNLTFFIEGINVTDETRVTFGRSRGQVLDAIQTGARYNIGARFEF